MKKLLLTCALMSCLMANAQTVKNPEINRLDSIGRAQYSEQKYANAISSFEDQLKLMKESLPAGDSQLIMNYVLRARCYYRMRLADKAVETAQQAVDLQKKYHGTDNKEYAFYLDNLALYQSSNKDPENALKNSLEAEQILSKIGGEEDDLLAIVMHVAENQSGCEKYADAVKTETRGLPLIADIYGVHSENYLNEAPYLVKYYSQAGMTDKAEKFENRIAQLKQEAEEGAADIPDEVNFKDAAGAKAHKWEALRCAKYILSHYVAAEKMGSAASYLMSWLENTDMMTVSIGSVEAKLIEKKDGTMLTTYFASCLKYAFENDQFQEDEDMFASAMVDVLNLYQSNLEKKYIKKSSFLDGLIKDYDKGNLEESIAKLWAEKEREMKIQSGKQMIYENKQGDIVIPS